MFNALGPDIRRIAIADLPLPEAGANIVGNFNIFLTFSKSIPDWTAGGYDRRTWAVCKRYGQSAAFDPSFGAQRG
jgi:hypothetical protein